MGNHFQWSLYTRLLQFCELQTGWTRLGTMWTRNELPVVGLQGIVRLHNTTHLLPSQPQKPLQDHWQTDTKYKSWRPSSIPSLAVCMLLMQLIAPFDLLWSTKHSGRARSASRRMRVRMKNVSSRRIPCLFHEAARKLLTWVGKTPDWLTWRKKT